MNVHDSERIAGSLDAAGYLPAKDGIDPDLVVFNTCAVRENADNKLYGQLSFLAPDKKARPGMQIAVGGCLAQKDQGNIIERAPYVDVVFGTHNVGSVSVGCNNTCTFCIVPALRGREKDRPASDILKEVRTLVDQGVTEITLLGQNVNAYGVDFNDPTAFAKLLRECGKVDGLERVRFMSPHPRDFTDDVIAAMAETENVMPHLHMPLQSGSNSILQAMRRSYRTDRYLGIIEKVRSAMPAATITTDIIVGFPGESEADFQGTLDICTQARFLAAYTFQYSKRPGTPAATMAGQVPESVVAERYTRLHEFQSAISLSVNQELVGKNAEVLVSEYEGRRDGGKDRMSGRSKDFRLVHFDIDPANSPRPGDLVTVEIGAAKAFFVTATGLPKEVKRSRGGDAYEARVAEAKSTGVMLGIPTLPKYNF